MARKSKKKTMPPPQETSGFLNHGNLRGAGILLHITSLPSPFGIGDLGPQAKAFADFLHRGKQKYWQVLPLNPVEQAQGYSPYSALSSMAGNPLVISPELLVEDGLLTRDNLKKYRTPSRTSVEFEKAERIKRELFMKAYLKFSTKTSSALHDEYNTFCRKESSWLDDFALYMALKTEHQKPWYEWPEAFKLRQPKALKAFIRENEEAIDQVKWLQFIFMKQWQDLKRYCNDLNIRLFGDLPFYVSYDSADVWANPEIFSLSEEGRMTGVAGVPPDYFNADGQLWGMPVFKWDVLKKRNYDWWISRLSKNIELYDLLRLDHFRAFADFWEVPATEKTAINGKWQPGPGSEFFNAVKKALGKLPFVAEDLGDINEAVHKLRQEFNFPGMKILQFSFGDNMSQSDYIPHNYIDPNFIAYTGTHDNNTTVGWYRKDIGKKERRNLSVYLGKRINEKNVHVELTRLAYSSVAAVTIIPVQDVFGLDESARMNVPASTAGNWSWRLQSQYLKIGAEKTLADFTELFNRG
jgi:4-alpha-glucanotransferase